MAFEKVEYSFPDPDGDAANQQIDIEDSSAVEIDISGKKDEPKVNGADDKGIKKATPKDEFEVEVVDEVVETEVEETEEVMTPEVAF